MERRTCSQALPSKARHNVASLSYLSKGIEMLRDNDAITGATLGGKLYGKESRGYVAVLSMSGAVAGIAANSCLGHLEL